MRLVLLGPPGAGKGSQAFVLSERLGLVHIASGDLLRETVRAKTPLGGRIQGYLQRGELVPDDVVTTMVMERVTPAAGGRGFVLDGFPRTRPQAVALDAELLQAGAPIDRALYLETSREVVIHRLAGRRICRACGMNYHVTNMPPQAEGVCDRCGGPLEQRDDDRPEAVSRRFEVYEAQTALLLTYYRQRGVLRVVNGNLSVEKLYQALMNLFQQEGLVVEGRGEQGV